MFPSAKNSAAPIHLLIGILAAAAAMVLPLTEALPEGDVTAARIVSAVLALTASIAAIFLGGKGRPLFWTIMSGLAGSLALLLLWQHIGARASCVGDHDGRPVIVGDELTPEGQTYITRNPRSSTEDLLLDAGGQSELMWTERSIARCAFRVSWGGLLVLPLLALCLSSLVAGRGNTWRWVSGKRAVLAAVQPATVQYDAFISYRRLDRERAEALLEELESRGFRVAIDFRDFRPNEQVLTEMERCIRESRFLLCVITEQYAASGFTTEEASIAKLLDLTERRNRIVPLVFDKVPMPAWLQELVGIDFGPGAQGDPIERLVTLLSSGRQTTA